MDNIFDSVIGLNTGKTKEDELFEKTDRERNCPYDKCNGSGIIPSDLYNTEASFCECHKERILKKKLVNSKINTKYATKNFDSYDTETESFLFKPKMEPEEFKPTTRIKSEIDEKPNAYIKRNYTKTKQKRSIQETLTSYCDKNLELLENKEDTANLLLFGDSGNGKTTFAILVGVYYLKKGKKVYFTTTQDFLDGIFNKEIDPKKIAREVDVLILDELFNEYHTDTHYAKKQLKEILKIREELGLITICTSNGNPKDFSLLYGPSMMSLINGTFFMFYLERKTDGRVEEIHNRYEDFGL